jgi:hypothetical protein
MKIDNIKEEITHDMENIRKKNGTETKRMKQNTMKGSYAHHYTTNEGKTQ